MAQSTPLQRIGTSLPGTPLFKRFAAALAVTLSLASGSSFAQRAYPTPDAAAEAFVNAVSRVDGDALRIVLGADWKRFVPVAGVDADDVYDFLGAWAKR